MFLNNSPLDQFINTDYIFYIIPTFVLLVAIMLLYNPILVKDRIVLLFIKLSHVLVKDKIALSFIKISHLLIPIFFLKSFGLVWLLPLVVSFINCVMYHLKMVYLDEKKSIWSYILFYLLSALTSYIIGSYFKLDFIIQGLCLATIHYDIMESCTCKLVPDVALEPYRGRTIIEYNGVQNINIKDWTVKEKLDGARKLRGEFIKTSHNFTKGDVALFRYILKEKGVQERWVIEPISTTNKIPMWHAIQREDYQTKVREYIEDLKAFNNKFSVGKKRIFN